MFKVKVNQDFLFHIEEKDKELFVDGQKVTLNLINLKKCDAHILYKNRSFNVEVVEFSMEDKTCKIKVNGNIYQVDIEDQFDQLLKQLGMDNLTSNKIAEIKAPMPGLVLKILVGENVVVKKGDNLLILEAMKMENILKSTTDGIIKKVMVKQGDKVDKNQILIQFS